MNRLCGSFLNADFYDDYDQLRFIGINNRLVYEGYDLAIPIRVNHNHHKDPCSNLGAEGV
jgi:hypothetical protein